MLTLVLFIISRHQNLFLFVRSSSKFCVRSFYEKSQQNANNNVEDIMQDASETELTSAATLITRYYIKPVIFLGVFFPQFIAAHTCLSTNSSLSVGCALVHNFDRKDALRCVCSWKICNLRPVCFVIVNSKIFVKATSTTVVTLLCTYLQHYSILWYAIPILDMVIQHPDAMQIILYYTVYILRIMSFYTLAWASIFL